MKILIACEPSGLIRDAFLEKGHDAWSCALGPSQTPGPHFTMDVVKLLKDEPEWDMLIARPPSDRIAGTSAKWFQKEVMRKLKQEQAVMLFMELANAEIPRIVIESPIGIMSTRWRKPDQVIQPYEFGHSVTRSICLWLKGLPKLEPTDVLEQREPDLSEQTNKRRKLRKMKAQLFPGIVSAMVDQWGNL